MATREHCLAPGALQHKSQSITSITALHFVLTRSSRRMINKRIALIVGLCVFVALKLEREQWPFLGGSTETYTSSSSVQESWSTKHAKYQSQIPFNESNLGEFAFAPENIAKRWYYDRGTYKVFFPLKATAEDGTKFGYVVAGNDPDEYRIMQATYEFANNIVSTQFGMRHCYFHPPQMVDISKSFQRWLHRQLYVSFKGFYPRRMVHLFNKTDGLVIELLEEIPTDTALIWGNKRKKKHDKSSGQAEALEWIQSIPKDEQSKVLKKLKNETAKLNDLVEAYPCVYRDFQIFVLRTGEIVHFDLDRCFDVNETGVYYGEAPKWTQKFRYSMESLLAMLEFEVYFK